MVWWLQFAIGLLVIAAGVMIIRHRVRIARWQARAYRRAGGWGAESSAKNITPGVMLVVGSIWIIVGTCRAATALFDVTGGS